VRESMHIKSIQVVKRLDNGKVILALVMELNDGRLCPVEEEFTAEEWDAISAGRGYWERKA
jgi:hypothetical protein